CLQTKSFPWTF
nr:immunoglobulin light chain junction region [Macaca mulatta]MOX56241.1 immunoglobulin light chain junction region [Macaca mulatta]MOX57074.1 immunoglobulin light chain junction region [Macaca mulatta]